MSRDVRIGLLVPAANITFEPDFASAMPAGATLHTHRLDFQRPHKGENTETVDEMNAGLPQAARMLARARVQIMAYGFTAATFYRGIAHAKHLEQQITEASGAKAVVPSLAMLAALAHLGIKRISIVTPYPAWNNQVLKSFMAETDCEVLSFAGDERPLSEASKSYLWHQPPEQSMPYVIKNRHPDAEAMFCPCTAWRIFEVVDRLEEALGIPVITANQATLWRVCRDLGLEPSARVGLLMRS
jgi:maleate isomerase